MNISNNNNNKINKNLLPIIKLVFETFDQDNSGAIDEKELKFALKSIGIKLSKEEFEEMIDSFNLEVAGLINFKEFTKLVNDVVLKNIDFNKEIENMFNIYSKQEDSLTLNPNMDLIEFEKLPKDVITLGKLTKLCYNYKIPVDIDFLTQMIATASNGKKYVNKDEFYQVMKEMKIID